MLHISLAVITGLNLFSLLHSMLPTDLSIYTEQKKELTLTLISHISNNTYHMKIIYISVFSSK